MAGARSAAAGRQKYIDPSWVDDGTEKMLDRPAVLGPLKSEDVGHTDCSVQHTLLPGATL